MDFYRGVRLDRQRLRLDRLGVLRARRAPVAAGAVRRPAQQEVWGEDNTTLVSSSYAPMGRAKPVEGGFVFSGRWSFSSGCDHAQWVFLGGLVMGEDGNPVDFRTFLLPRSDYEIDDVWDTIGLRGTGSNDIIVTDAFVPEHRTLSFMDTGRCSGPGQAVNTARSTSCRSRRCSRNSIAVPMHRHGAGCVRGLRVVDARAGARVDRAARPRTIYNQVRIAEAAWRIDSAVLQIERNIDEALDARQCRREDPDAAAGPGTPRPGQRHRVGDRRRRPDVRERGRPGAEGRHADPAVLARRARRPGARDQRPREGDWRCSASSSSA